MNQSKLIECLSSFLETADIQMNDSLISLGLDSLKTVELIICLEDEFNITFNDSDLNLENFTTVNDIYNCILKYF